MPEPEFQVFKPVPGFLCFWVPRRGSCGSQRSEGHDPAEDHPIRLRRFLQRPLHHPAGEQRQMFLHLCLQQVALQQDSERQLWCCLVCSNRRDARPTQCQKVNILCLHRKCVKEAIVEKFAGPYDRGEFSPSVQKTLYDSQVLILQRLPEVSSRLRTSEKKTKNKPLS